MRKLIETSYGASGSDVLILETKCNYTAFDGGLYLREKSTV